MNLHTAFRLGRVSNLPTVWSNVLAGVALAGVGADALSILALLLATSLIYTAGMYLNDVFDEEYDRQYRPDRPIAAGEVSTLAVTCWGAAMMLAALLILSPKRLSVPVESWYPLLAGSVLCLLVLIYDRWHKKNRFAPLIMGLCRGMVYLVAVLGLLAEFSISLAISVAGLTAWVLGLTLVARRKNILAGLVVLVCSVALILVIAGMRGFPDWVVIFLFMSFAALIYAFVFHGSNGKFWNSVTLLIAAISLFDALVIISVTGELSVLAITCLGLFFLTLLFQRSIEGS